MATFRECKGFHLAFALAWGDITNPKKEAAEANRHTRSVEGEYRVRWIRNREIKYGVAADVKSSIDNLKSGQLLSAAVLFASVAGRLAPREPNSILILPLDAHEAEGRIADGGRFAVIALLGGSPYMDTIVSLDKLADTIKTLKLEAAPFMREGESEPHFAMYGHVPGLDDLTPFRMEDLLSGDRKAAAMKRFVDRSFLTTAIVTMVIVAAVVGGWQWWQLEQKRRAEEEARKRAIDPVAAYTASRATLLGKTGYDGTAALKSTWQSFKGRDAVTMGWRLRTVSCKPASCEESWEPKNGTYTAFSQAMGKVGVIKLSQDGKTITLGYSLKFARQPLKFESLPSNAAFWPHLIELQEQYKAIEIKPVLGFKPSPARIDGVPTGVQPSGVPPNIAVLTGYVEITGPQGLLVDALERLPKNISIESLVLNFGQAESEMDAMNFSLKGKYYVKN